MDRNFIKGALFLSLAAAIWGGMYVVSKVVLNYIDPWLLLEFRFIIGLITLGSAAWYLKAWRIAKKDLGIMALIGLVGYTGSIGMQFVGVKLSNASLGSLITSASPALIAIFAFFILKEPLYRHRVIALIVASIGVLFIIGSPQTEGNGSFFLGNIFLCGAAITWALYTVLSRTQTQKYGSLTVTTWATLFGVIFTLPIVFIEQQGVPINLPTNIWIWLGVLYLGVVSTAIAFYLWNLGFEYIDTNRGSLFFFIQPFVGTLLGFSLLGEPLTLGFFIGAILIAIAIYFSAKDDKKIDKKIK